MNYDVTAAVIGGGPAGISCAISLQKQGTSNCVIEKARFPRNKTCAGLVTVKTYELLKKLCGGDGEALSSMFCHSANKVAFYDRNRLLSETETGLEFRLAERTVLDSSLADLYKSAGGILLEGQRDYITDYDNNIIMLRDGSTVRYQYLLFADGALSRAHKDFALKPENLGFSIETFIPGEMLQRTAIQMHFGYIDNGYIWLFPYGDRMGAGVISTYGEDKPYLQILKDYINELGVPADSLSYRGAFVPFGKAVDQKTLPDNILLAGDAGGFADPIYGEGLYMALFTGMQAAASLSERYPKEAFLKSAGPAYQMIRSGYRLQKLLNRPAMAGVFPGKLEGKSGFVKFYCDSQVSSYRYGHMDILRLVKDYKKQKKDPAQ